MNAVLLKPSISGDIGFGVGVPGWSPQLGPLPRIDWNDPVNKKLAFRCPMGWSTRDITGTLYYELVSGNHAVVTGSPTLTFPTDTTTPNDWGFRTTGGNMKAASPYNPPTTNFTVLFRFRLNASSGVQNRACGNSNNGTGTSGVGVIFGFPSAAQILTLIRKPSTVDITVSLGAILVGWHEWAITIDSVAGGTVYLDGVSVGTNAGATSIVSNGGWTIGTDVNNTQSLDGWNRDHRIFERVLTPQEIADYSNDKYGWGGLIQPSFPPFYQASVAPPPGAYDATRMLLAA